MSIFRNSSQYSTGTPGGSSYTISSYDPGYAGTEKGRIIIIGVANPGNSQGQGEVIYQCSYGGVAMNSVFEVNDYASNQAPGIEIFYIINPPTGAQDIIFNTPGSAIGTPRVGIVAYYSDTDFSFRVGRTGHSGLGNKAAGVIATELTTLISAGAANSWMFGIAANFNSQDQTLQSSYSQGTLNPGTMADDATIGTGTWNYVDNAKVSDNTYADSAVHVGAPYGLKFYSVKIVKGGTIQGDEKSTGTAVSGTESTISYGSSSDLWGLSWTTADINGSTFGAVISFSYSDDTGITHYLKATNFSFSVPNGSTINGIIVNVECKGVYAQSFSIINVDNINIQVYYTISTSQYVVGAGNPSSFQIVDSNGEVLEGVSSGVGVTVASAPALGLWQNVITFLPIRKGIIRFIID